MSTTDQIASTWNRIWDEALESGVRGTRLMQGLFAVLSRPVFGDRACPRCKGIISTSYPEHITKHLSKYSIDTVVLWLENKNFKGLKKLAEEITSLNLGSVHVHSHSHSALYYTSGKNHFHEMNGDVGMAGWK